MSKNKKTYLGEITQAAKSVAKGMSLAGKHLRKGLKTNEPLGIADPGYFEQNQGPITIQYPKAQVPVPDEGRYRLFMETEDCIGCDKCARICPVDCITIETFRADGDLGKTSDGTIKRLHLPVFDIDMGKCMYCGLCTTVCPTLCLFMTKVYDFSEFDRDNLVYHFGAYSPEQEAEIRVRTEAALALKKAAKAKAAAEKGEAPKKKRPMMRRKPVTSAPETTETPQQENAEAPAPKPSKRKRPVMKRKPAEPDTPAEKPEASEEAPAEAKPKKRSRPVMKRKPAEPDTPEASEEAPAEAKPKRSRRNVLDPS